VFSSTNDQVFIVFDDVVVRVVKPFSIEVPIYSLEECARFIRIAKTASIS
jgi:hypothetical protein